MSRYRRSTISRFLSQRQRRKRAVKTPSKRATTIKLDSTIANEIWGIIYLGVAIIIILSINESFGIVGEILSQALSPILGWGIYVIPGIFIITALVFFLSKKVRFGMERTFGVIFIMASILSILHLYVPIEDLYDTAQLGQYGGYVGFVSNFILRNLLGISHLGAGVIFFLTFLISILLTFEISLIKALSLFRGSLRIERRPIKKAKTEEEASDKYTDELFKSDEVAVDDDDQIIQIRRTHLSPKIAKSAESKKEVQPVLPGFTGDTKSDYSEWQFPSLDLLDEGKATVEINDKVLKANAEKIRSKLVQFGINVTMHEVHVGPTVIQYTLKPDEAVKLSRIIALKNDLALALAAESVRIEAPIPGKSLVGIEVPNDHRSLVHLRELMESTEFNKIDSRLRLPMGLDVSGKAIVADLASMPHLLIAGATGSGKSVGMNSFLLSLLYQNSPEHLKMIMIDTKRVELNYYNSIPHLLTPVITDPEKAAQALKWATVEMSHRYQLCAEAKHRNIIDYNADKKIDEKMPNIVIIVDELADLMMVSGKEVENHICRIAQMARAVGIHLIIATQRPSVNVITGLIKANIPARIAYAVSSSIDSRTIIDGGGAEDLLGKGDMLYLGSGTGKLVRIQGIFVSSKEIERVTNKVKLTMSPNYSDDIFLNENQMSFDDDNPGEDEDDLYQPALEVIRRHRKASASLLQRRLKIGYARAARLLDLLEEDGKIGPVNGAKAREIYVE